MPSTPARTQSLDKEIKNTVPVAKTLQSVVTPRFFYLGCLECSLSLLILKKFMNEFQMVISLILLCIILSSLWSNIKKKIIMQEAVMTMNLNDVSISFCLFSSKQKHALVHVLWAALGKLDNRNFRAVTLMNSLLSFSLTQTQFNLCTILLLR